MFTLFGPLSLILKINPKFLSAPGLKLGPFLPTPNKKSHIYSSFGSLGEGLTSIVGSLGEGLTS